MQPQDDADWQATWKACRNVERSRLFSLIVGLLGMLMLAEYRRLDAPLAIVMMIAISLALTWLSVTIIASVRMHALQCPRCKQNFFSDFDLAISAHCNHCGLPKYAPREAGCASWTVTSKRAVFEQAWDDLRNRRAWTLWAILATLPVGFILVTCSGSKDGQHLYVPGLLIKMLVNPFVHTWLLRFKCPQCHDYFLRRRLDELKPYASLGGSPMFREDCARCGVVEGSLPSPSE